MVLIEINIKHKYNYQNHNYDYVERYLFFIINDITFATF